MRYGRIDVVLSISLLLLNFGLDLLPGSCYSAGQKLQWASLLSLSFFDESSNCGSWACGSKSMSCCASKCPITAHTNQSQVTQLILFQREEALRCDRSATPDNVDRPLAPEALERLQAL